LLRWLLLDGYGFHQAYFHTAQYVEQQFRDTRFGWPDGPSSYVDRGIDQGIGRALWFVGGTDAELVCTTIEKFAPQRHTDLYSGAGLAATYAGGVEEDELELFWKRAGGHRPMVAQAAAFAAEARVRAGLVTPFTGRATQVFCGMTPEEAAAVSIKVRPASAEPVGGVPAYEVWRQRIAAEFVALGRS
jgi:hypothetical protein